MSAEGDSAILPSPEMVEAAEALLIATMKEMTTKVEAGNCTAAYMETVRKWCEFHGLFLDCVTDSGTKKREEGTRLLKALQDPEALEADVQRQAAEAMDREQRQRDRSE